MRRSDPQQPLARHARRRATWKRVAVASTVTVALVAGSGAVAAAYYVDRLDDNINRVEIGSLIEGPRPTNTPEVEQEHDPLDILLIGSDSRSGDNGGLVGGIAADGLSDTVILLHVSGDRKSAYGVSIPRDSMVQIPVCKRGGEDYFTGNRLTQFNEAYTIGAYEGDKAGGAACTMKTVEQATGVSIEHFVVVDFVGFNNMVNALGGVEVCLPEAVDDDRYNIHLRAGRNTIKGREARDYVRARHNIGDGTDLSRTERQQYFISSMIRKAQGQVLKRPDRLVRFLEAATKSLTTDMSFTEMRTLAQSVLSIGLSDVVFTTVPTVPWPENINRLIWTSQADAVWQGMADDTGLPGMKPKPKPKPSASSTPLPSVSTPPSNVRVRVVDGTGSEEHAEQVADDLRDRGFQVVETVVGEDEAVTQTVVRHDPGYDESGRTLSTSVPGSELEVAPELSNVLEIVVGSDYAGTTEVKATRTSPTPTVTGPPLALRNAKADGCSESSAQAAGE